MPDRKRSLDNDNDDDASPQKRQHPNDETPTAGILAEVYVENFMCHAKFRVRFSPNVNFVHGQNGSGKSAILAAIKICMGASARQTNRAGNLTGLIRKVGNSTASKAIVRVALWNGGPEGYQPEVYGNKVTIERTILRQGGGGYKLYDENMKEKSRSKKDLDDLLDTL